MTARIGDLVYLEDERLGVLGASAQGLDDGEPVRAYTAGSPFSANAAVFVLEVQGTWKHLNEYKRALDRDGINWVEAAGERTYREARESVKKGGELNDQEFSRAGGRKVRAEGTHAEPARPPSHTLALLRPRAQVKYGAIVQLRHNASGKYLCPGRLPISDPSMIGNQLVLDENAGEVRVGA